MHSGAAGVFLAFGLNFGASLLTSTEGGATGLPATGSKVTLPILGAAGQPERNRTRGQSRPLKAGSYYLLLLWRVNTCKTHSNQ